MASAFKYTGESESHQTFNEIYFRTLVIKDWKHLPPPWFVAHETSFINHPLPPHWQLCKEPTEYRFSLAKFYETGEDEFKILTHLMDKW